MQLSKKQILRIKQTIQLDGTKSIVRIDVSHKDEGWSDEESNFNIYHIDVEYNILWQIKETKTKPVSLFGEADPFYYLGKDANDKIIADRFSGFTYEIDPETGEATRTGFHK